MISSSAAIRPPLVPVSLRVCPASLERIGRLYAIESAKLAGVNPRAYLGEAARRAIRNPGTVTLPRDRK
jgi:hypothetical protein